MMVASRVLVDAITEGMLTGIQATPGETCRERGAQCGANRRGRVKPRIVARCVLALSMLMAASVCWPPPAAAESQSVAEVWAREEDYWRFVKAGDVEGYVALWHEKFIGWPCDQEHPLRKSSIGGWVQKIRDQKIQVTSVMTREGAEEFGPVVVVHYRFTRVDTYPDGRVEGQGRESKITHTWMRVGPTWQIIGGMCGSLAQGK